MNNTTLNVSRNMRAVRASRRKAQMRVLIDATQELASTLCTLTTLVGGAAAFYIIAVIVMV